ncbi:MAG: type I DNA topoisomerase [Gammaproteobacteria bacterium]|nr:type I DNA topoisomerase [Gammaproteobacteria bacterium]
MAKNLLIVESPAKSRTIKKYLGADFEVLASYGHVRDLRPKEGAVEPDDGFAMHYELIERNTKHVTAIVKAMRKADALYLATDPDREGEAIAWHLVEILGEKGVLKDKPLHRVVFHEITKKAILEAMDEARDLATDLVNAQQARRALDYLVGFNLSPLLWRKVRRGLSAGRVQSPALRMIAERELEIEAFKPREYWSIEADLAHDEQPFMGRLYQYQGERTEQFSFENERDAFAVQAALKVHAVSGLDVVSVEKKQRRRNPAPPFTTSTLQQEASRKLSFPTQKTMRVAQQLYEGIDSADAEAGGLITYMRTDSVNLAAEAIADIRQYISDKHPDVGFPAEPRSFKTKAKNAQEAHEAIRPTDITRTPDSLKGQLDADQAKLYELIWKRTLACQMAHALIDTVSVDLACGEGNLFRATGSTVAKPGFMVVYEESIDARKASDDERRLPRLEEGDRVALTDIRADQHFTEPPPRYTEATLVKSLEEHGIGRPSTYATIISTLQQREYVTLEKRRFFLTDVGRVVSRFLTEHFNQYVDYGFTASLEDDLDAISRGEKEWIPVMERFWESFKSQVDLKHETVKRSDVTQEKLDEECPECSQPLAIRLGRRGRFIGCTAFPECKYTRSLEAGTEEERAQVQAIEGRECPKCASPLLVREGKYGKFIGCSGYPDCSHIEALDPPVDTGHSCPQCSAGAIMRRKSRRGKIFYSCATYPKCDYAIWNEPVEGPCPNCAWPILTIKTTKRRGTERVCPQRCGFSEAVESTEEETVAAELPQVS